MSVAIGVAHLTQYQITAHVALELRRGFVARPEKTLVKLHGKFAVRLKRRCPPQDDLQLLIGGHNARALCLLQQQLAIRQRLGHAEADFGIVQHGRIDLAAGHLLHHLLLFTQRHVKFLLIDRAPINRGDRGRGFAAAQVRIDTKKKEWRNDQQRQNQLQRTFVPVNKIKHVQYTLI